MSALTGEDVAVQVSERERLLEDLYALSRTRENLYWSGTHGGEHGGYPFHDSSNPFGALPTLHMLWQRTELPTDTLGEFLEDAIGRIPDQSHRAAALDIFGENAPGWASLRERQTRAATHFAIGYDAYRRRRRSGRSLYDDTVAALAASLERGKPADRGPLPSRPALGTASALRRGQLQVSTLLQPSANVGRRVITLELPEEAYQELQLMAERHDLRLGELIRRALLVQDFLFLEPGKRLLIDDGEVARELLFAW